MAEEKAGKKTFTCKQKAIFDGKEWDINSQITTDNPDWIDKLSRSKCWEEGQHKFKLPTPPPVDEDKAIAKGMARREQEILDRLGVNTLEEAEKLTQKRKPGGI